MSDSIGLIFHENWNEFSPLMYYHYGADGTPFQIQNYMKQYLQEHELNNRDGHIFSPCHMMVGLLQSMSKSVHIRVENLTEQQIETLQEHHDYPNYFDGGCWIINVSTDNFGDTVCGDNYTLENDNIVKDELKSIYEEDYRY